MLRGFDLHRFSMFFLGKRLSWIIGSENSWGPDSLSCQNPGEEPKGRFWMVLPPAAAQRSVLAARNRKRNTTWTWQSTLPVAVGKTLKRWWFGVLKLV